MGISLERPKFWVEFSLDDSADHGRMKCLGFFEVDADISKKYNEHILEPITDDESLRLLAQMGIRKIFHGEQFYHATVGADDFIGRTAAFNLIATIHGKIYKIYFKFVDDNRPACMAFREKIHEYLSEQMTPHQFSSRQIRKIRHGRMSIWRFDWGNILLEEFWMLTHAGTIWNTAIGSTSTAVKNAKRIGFLDRMLKRV